MKVLKNNYNKEKEEHNQPLKTRLTCDNCSSILEYEAKDIKVGTFGCAYINCPCCKYSNDVDVHSINLTKDNIEFPTHFARTSKENGAIDCFNHKEIKKCINQAINYLRENKDEYSYVISHGNLYIHVLKFDNDELYEIMVTNDFYETILSFESEDY